MTPEIEHLVETLEKANRVARVACEKAESARLTWRDLSREASEACNAQSEAERLLLEALSGRNMAVQA